MPFQRKTLSDLITQVTSDVITGLQATSSSLLRYSPLRIVSKALAKAVNGLYGYLDWIALQAVPATATGEYAVAWGAMKGKTIKAASQASGAVSFTGTNGKVIPAGSGITRGDGTGYVTTADATIAFGVATAPIIAADAGAVGNAPVGTSLTLGVAIAGVSTAVTVSTIVAGGADIESIDDFRTRYLQAFANPPQGGAEPDYIGWAEGVPGVTRAWVRRNGMGVGTVVVYFMMDDAEASFGGFPQGTIGVGTLEPRDAPATGDQLVVANAIYPVQPVTALVYAVAPSQNILSFTIAGLSGASIATKGAVTAAIQTALLDSSPGGVTLPDGTAGGVTQLSVIERAIAAIPAAAGFVITNVTASAGAVSPGAFGNVTSNTGAIAVLGLPVTFS